MLPSSVCADAFGQIAVSTSFVAVSYVDDFTKLEIEELQYGVTTV